MKRLSVILIASVGLLGIAGALIGGGGLMAPAPAAPQSLRPSPSIPLPTVGEGSPSGQGEGVQKSKASSAGTPIVGTDIGQLAPDFSLMDLESQTLKLSDLRGRVVLLNFWASTCPYCRREMPLLQKIAHAHSELDVVGVNLFETKDAIETFVWDLGVTYRIVQDAWGEASVSYRVVKLPATFLIDPQGIVRWKKFGIVNEQELEEHLKNLEGK